jgi:hypothetical protein
MRGLGSNLALVTERCQLGFKLGEPATRDVRLRLESIEASPFLRDGVE